LGGEGKGVDLRNAASHNKWERNAPQLANLCVTARRQVTSHSSTVLTHTQSKHTRKDNASILKSSWVERKFRYTRRGSRVNC
jgi:hypothetical protein